MVILQFFALRSARLDRTVECFDPKIVVWSQFQNQQEYMSLSVNYFHVSQLAHARSLSVLRNDF